MSFSIQKVEEKLLVSIHQGIDLSNTQLFEKALGEKIAEGIRIFILDLSRVNYLDSSAVGMIVRIHRLLKEKNGEIILACCGENLQKLFQLLNFQKYFKMCKTLEEAFNC